MSATRALQSATTVNADALERLDRIDSVDKGKFAYVIAVFGNITELQRVGFVMKGGSNLQRVAPLQPRSHNLPQT